MSTHDEETARLNRMVEDVFWLRYGREPDPEDQRDQERMIAISDWQARGARLPGESLKATEERCAKIRAVREVTG